MSHKLRSGRIQAFIDISLQAQLDVIGVALSQGMMADDMVSSELKFVGVRTLNPTYRAQQSHQLIAEMARAVFKITEGSNRQTH